MTGTPTIYRGEDATLYIGSGGTADKLSHSTLAISDFSLTLSKGVAEQELIGEKGNFFLAGALSAEGSLTACKLHTSAVGGLVREMIDGRAISVSGNCGAESLHFYLRSCQLTGFDFSIGTADEITEGTIDYTVLYPYAISVQRNLTYKYIQDDPGMM
jgi:hypothetical protein